MVRSFRTPKCSPSIPTRSCRKNTEPGESSLMAIAAASRIGDTTTRPAAAITMSKARFATPRQPNRSHRLDVKHGSPPERPRDQAVRRDVDESRRQLHVVAALHQLSREAICERDIHRARCDDHTGRVDFLHDLDRVAPPPEHGHRRDDAIRRVAVEQADDLVAELGIALQHADDTQRFGVRADHDHPALELSARTCPAEEHTHEAPLGQDENRAKPRKRREATNERSVRR